jgi:hypothetical protein
MGLLIGAGLAWRIRTTGALARPVAAYGDAARKLHVSTATVKTHINNRFAKTGLKDRAQAVRYAYGKGLVRPTMD